MLKDINRPKVDGVIVAVAQEMSEGESVWNVYLINTRDQPIEGVIVNSSGYGELNGKKVKTSMLRYFLDVVPARSSRLVEPIITEVLALSSQYWVSFYLKKELYDKKFIFVPGSIDERNLVELPVLGGRGVMIT